MSDIETSQKKEIAHDDLASKCGHGVSWIMCKAESCMLRDTVKRLHALTPRIPGDERFAWGRVIEVHAIGTYLIVEHHPRKYDGIFAKKEIDTAKRQFHLWIDGKDASQSFETLDAALAGGIAYRAEGPNHRADLYFIAALNNLYVAKGPA